MLVGLTTIHADGGRLVTGIAGSDGAGASAAGNVEDVGEFSVASHAGGKNAA